MMGTEESRSVSLRVQLSTAPMLLVPMRSTATRGVVCGSSPLRRRQFRLLIWSSAARPRASQIQCGPLVRCFRVPALGSPALCMHGPDWTRLAGGAALVFTKEQVSCSATPCTTGAWVSPGALWRHAPARALSVSAHGLCEDWQADVFPFMPYSGNARDEEAHQR